MKEIKSIDENKKSSVIFLSGVGLTTFCVSFMIGASSTPVVAIVVPTVFGLVTSSIGLLQNHLPKGEVNTHGEPDSSDGLGTKQRRVGSLLITFSVFYLLGLGTGIGARIGEWHRIFSRNTQISTFAKRTFPWEGTTTEQPKSVANTLNWICFQEKLIAMGYTLEQVKMLYSKSEDKNISSLNSSFYSNCFGVSSNMGQESSPFVGQAKPMSPFILLKPANKGDIDEGDIDYLLRYKGDIDD